MLTVVYKKNVLTATMLCHRTVDVERQMRLDHNRKPQKQQQQNSKKKFIKLAFVQNQANSQKFYDGIVQTN